MIGKMGASLRVQNELKFGKQCLYKCNKPFKILKFA